MTARRRNQSWPYWLAVWIVAAATLSAVDAKAETALHLGGWSTHLLTDDATNESHDMILAEHENWLAGRFNNSYGRESYAIAYGDHWQILDVRLSGYIGAVRGYKECFGNEGKGSRTCPFVAASAAYTRYFVQPEVIVLGDAVVFAARIRL